MIRLDVFVGTNRAGVLTHDSSDNLFSFIYDENWAGSRLSYPLSPALPFIKPSDQTPEFHGRLARTFFENLLPEGQALEDASIASQISKSNTVGLLIALGAEMSGAVRVLPSNADIDDQPARRREISRAEISAKIRDRANQPFSQVDGKIRLSIAGFQDKMAVLERLGKWYVCEGRDIASTHILKPAPRRPEFVSIPENEFVCMQLSTRVGLPTAETRLEFLPEPVLVVKRFDRVSSGTTVHRVHVIDACQGLGLASGAKYERPYGDGEHVRGIRDGVSFERLFDLIDAHSVRKAQDRTRLLRWAIFQSLIGNTDAHGKNVSFFQGPSGIRLAPWYDQISMAALGADFLDDTYAMAFGDAFTEPQMCAFEWLEFARTCKLSVAWVSAELGGMARSTLAALDDVAKIADRAGVNPNVVASIREVVELRCAKRLDEAALMGPAQTSHPRL